MSEKVNYPRWVIWRTVLRSVIRTLLWLLTDLRVVGLEHVPEKGPLILAMNHFHFADPAIIIGVIPRHLEFIAGNHRPNAPLITRALPELYGVYTVHRGSTSRRTMRETKAVLAQGGFVGIFPEGGAWATVLRPARPGTAYLAVSAESPILPIGIDGMENLFKKWRPRITVQIGKPFGPFKTTGRGKQRREQLAQIGDEMMQKIAEQLPEVVHGVFSADPDLRKSAEAVADYPFDDLYEQGKR